MTEHSPPVYNGGMTSTVTYLATIPNRYHNEPHPLGDYIRPDDLIEVEAVNNTHARVKLIEAIGFKAWTSILDPRGPVTARVVAQHYPGKRIALFPTAYGVKAAFTEAEAIAQG